MKTVLFLVDMQNDFCQPTGALYVPGAEKDAERLSVLIDRRKESIDQIILTQDVHHVMDIAHPCYWTNAGGEHPEPYTVITWQEVELGTWIPFGNREEIIVYLRELIETGEYRHMIWPEHCLAGSVGAAFTPIVTDAVQRWARQGRYYQVVQKGIHPSVEFFGAFRANIPVPGLPETSFNMKLKNELETYDTIWLAGEAKSHCVAVTIKQLLDYPEIMRKLVILEDCTSNIPGCEELAIPIYEEAARLGARFMKSDSLLLA